MLTVFIKSGPQSTNPLASAAVAPAGGGAPELKLGNGAILDLGPGEDVQTVDPNRPNQAFDPFVQAILRQVGVAIEVPFELLIKHFTASYSAARAALLEAWKCFSSWRSWLAAELCQPAYEEVITEAVARGVLIAPGFFADPYIRAAYLGADWIGPAPGQIDPMKEAEAAEKMISLEAKTREQVTVELTGGDWKRNHRQRAREERMRREDGLVEIAPAAPGRAGPPAPVDQGVEP
jgi:lambda family phage portal protein